MAKTKPSGIRFDEENLTLAMRMSSKKTKQGLVDFLISEYCRLFRIEEKPVFQQEVVEPKKEEKQSWIEAGKRSSEPDIEYNFDYFQEAFGSAKTSNELSKLVLKMQSKITSPTLKKELEILAYNIQEDKFSNI